MTTFKNSSKEKALIHDFYTAFKNLDYQTMKACYHPEVEFEDAVFKLKQKEVGAMWHMLCERAQNFDLEFEVSEQNGKISAHWEPKYTFSQTGNKVHNIIDAEFEFKDGKIIRHIDNFSFPRWSRQALGLPGLLLGWTPFLHKKVSNTAHKGLSQFIAKHSEYQ